MTSLLPRFVTMTLATLVLGLGLSCAEGRAAEPAILAKARAAARKTMDEVRAALGF